MESILIISLGFFAQGLFFIRTIAQWFKSEKEGEVISPVIYWQISLVASIMMLTYGILRHDFAIVMGQSLVYGIYIRNLQLKNVWKQMHWLLKYITQRRCLSILDDLGNYRTCGFYLPLLLPVDSFREQKGIVFPTGILDYQHLRLANDFYLFDHSSRPCTFCSSQFGTVYLHA